MTVPRTRTTARGTGNASRKRVRPPPAVVDPPKPAGIEYHALDKDPQQGGPFRYEWTRGACHGTGRKIQCSITIDDPVDWQARNIVGIDVPVFEGLSYGGPRVYFHKLVAPQFKAFFKAVEVKGLKSHILTQVGSFVPRTITGHPNTLSNHAFGTAIDLNAAWNGYARPPAARGKEGSLSALADFCADFGIYWGGWYRGSKDGMHFECVDIMNEAALRSACRTHNVDYDALGLPRAPPPAPPAKAT